MNDAGMFKDARPIGPDVQYKSSSIAAIPFVKELVVPTENYKPKSDPKAFQYCKDGMGMSGLNLFAKGKNDPRQPRYIFVFFIFFQIKCNVFNKNSYKITKF